MELAEAPRRKDADEQHAQAERQDVACRPWIESTDVRDYQIPNHRVEESPDNIDRCRGEPLAGRFGKGALKGASHPGPGQKRGRDLCATHPPTKKKRAR